ncbi:MAG: DUF4367 domain-containing protein [Bacillota bacterium]
MMRENQHSDRLKQIIEERMKGCDPPSTEELWERFKARLEERRRTRLSGRLLLGFAMAGTAALLILVLIGFSVFPAQLRAITDKVVAFKTTLTESGDKLTLTGKGKNVLPPLTNQKPYTLKQLKEKAPFSVRLPACIPKGYRLVGHTGEDVSGSLVRITSRYEANGKFITVEQCGSETPGGDRAFDPGDYKITELKICGAKGTLVERKKDDWLSLSWNQGEVFYRISGCMLPKEALKMAESMKEI